MTWPWFAPTWKFWLAKEPSRSFTPLNAVVWATRSISALSCCTSLSRAARSLALLVALSDCTDSSRMRCRLFVTSWRAPSPVCASEIPSFALRAAWFKPLICDVKRSAMARPAASSFALLMRRPEDRRCSAMASALPDVCRFFCASSDIMFVLMTSDMMTPQVSPTPAVEPEPWAFVTGRPGAPRVCMPCIGPPEPNLSAVRRLNLKCVTVYLM